MYAYDWPNSTIAMMANWGTIIFCLFTLPILWMQQKCGLRATVLLSKLKFSNSYTGCFNPNFNHVSGCGTMTVGSIIKYHFLNSFLFDIKLK